MARSRTRVDEAARSKRLRATIGIAVIVLCVGAAGAWFVGVRNSRQALDSHLCPPKPASFLALLVDVTDPMTLPQRQDLRNKLEELKGTIPLYGRVAIFKVDAARERLLAPVLELCNPGKGSDYSSWTADRKKMQERWDNGFDQPLTSAFESLTVASAAEQSPILQSMQSVALTELPTSKTDGADRHLVVISDLLQNTPGLSFYGRIPTAQEVTQSPTFATGRTDLRGVKVDLWMLERPDFSSTQPRALAELWAELVSTQNGTLGSVYRVSG